MSNTQTTLDIRPDALPRPIPILSMRVEASSQVKSLNPWPVRPCGRNYASVEGILIAGSVIPAMAHPAAAQEIRFVPDVVTQVNALTVGQTRWDSSSMGPIPRNPGT
jgi:hypothetical protein